VTHTARFTQGHRGRVTGASGHLRDAFSSGPPHPKPLRFPAPHNSSTPSLDLRLRRRLSVRRVVLLVLPQSRTSISAIETPDQEAFVARFV
jgi:hypothetical protein